MESKTAPQALYGTESQSNLATTLSVDEVNDPPRAFPSGNHTNLIQFRECFCFDVVNFSTRVKIKRKIVYEKTFKKSSFF